VRHSTQIHFLLAHHPLIISRCVRYFDRVIINASQCPFTGHGSNLVGYFHSSCWITVNRFACA